MDTRVRDSLIIMAVLELHLGTSVMSPEAIRGFYYFCKFFLLAVIIEQEISFI
jgi:hypothetical protein